MTFSVFIVLLTDGYVDAILATIVKRGFTVSPLSTSGKPFYQNPDYIGGNLSLNITIDKLPDQKGNRTIEPTSVLIREEIDDILRAVSANYFAIIVHDGGKRFASASSNIKAASIETYRNPNAN